MPHFRFPEHQNLGLTYQFTKGFSFWGLSTWIDPAGVLRLPDPLTPCANLAESASLVKYRATCFLL